MRAGELTLQQAADALGVHYMTVYRYVRLGVLPATRAGRAWVVHRDDLDELVATRQAEAGEALSHRSVDWAGRLRARLLAGDRIGAKNVVNGALAAGADPDEVHLEVIAPAMREIGAGWAAGTCDVAHEHRASVIAGQIVSLLDTRFSRRGVRRGVVVAGCAPGERHSLPLRLVSGTVRRAGWEVEDLGADVPARSFAVAVAEAERLVAVAVSSTTPGNESAVVAAVEAIREAADVPVLVGGGAVPDEDTARRLGGDGWARDARGVVGILEDLHIG